MTEMYYYGKTWFEAKWASIGSDSISIVRHGNWTGSPPICFNIARKMQNICVVMDRSNTMVPGTFSLPKLSTILSVFPQAKVVLFSELWFSKSTTDETPRYHYMSAMAPFPYSSWIHSSVRLVAEHPTPTEVVGQWRHFSKFDFDILGTSLEDIQKNIRIIGTPSSWWMSRIWSISEKLKAAGSHTLRRESGKRGVTSPIGFNYSGDIETFRVNDMPEEFRNDLLALYGAMADFRVEIGARGTAKRKTFERELEEELMSWPNWMGFNWTFGEQFDSEVDQRLRASELSKTIREGPLLRTILE
jgi:hypothetical protein